MARMYGKNSGYLKRKDLKHYTLAGIIPIIFLILVWVVFKNYKQLGDWGFVFAVLLLVIIAVIFEPAIRNHKKRSNQYYRGMIGEYKIEDESLNLSDDYSIFKDIMINPERGNIDFAIVGPGGVYALEVKSHSGNVDFNGAELTRNGKPFEKDFLKQVKSEALQIHDFIKGKLNLDIYVKPVIVFSGRINIHFGLKTIEGVYVIGKNFLDEFFNSENRINFPKLKIEEILRELSNKN